MKKQPMLCLAVLLYYTTHAQLTVDPGASLTLGIGTQLHVDGLTLTPSADFLLSNFILTKSATAIHSLGSPYISRVYQFSNTSNTFSGSVQINYSDGAELNGIPEGALTLNIHNGTTWTSYPPDIRDASNNFVLTEDLNNISLNELTLARQVILPLTWLSFTVTVQNNRQSLLQWATAQEQNTRDFFIQHSADGINWATIGSLKAAGNSNAASHYNYVHTNPFKGFNYYRIKQTDVDRRYSYSPVKMLSFTSTLQPFTILGNPVANDVLTIQVNKAASLAFYSANGNLLWQEQVNAGTKSIDVSRYAKGTYLLQSNNTTQRVVIQ